MLEKKQEEYVEKYRHLQYIEVCTCVRADGWVFACLCVLAGVVCVDGACVTHECTNKHDPTRDRSTHSPTTPNP